MNDDNSEINIILRLKSEVITIEEDEVHPHQNEQNELVVTDQKSTDQHCFKEEKSTYI